MEKALPIFLWMWFTFVTKDKKYAGRIKMQKWIFFVEHIFFLLIMCVCISTSPISFFVFFLSAPNKRKDHTCNKKRRLREEGGNEMYASMEKRRIKKISFPVGRIFFFWDRKGDFFSVPHFQSYSDPIVMLFSPGRMSVWWYHLLVSSTTRKKEKERKNGLN